MLRSIRRLTAILSDHQLRDPCSELHRFELTVAGEFLEFESRGEKCEELRHLRSQVKVASRGGRDACAWSARLLRLQRIRTTPRVERDPR